MVGLQSDKKYPFVDVCNLPKDRKLVLFPLQYEFEASLYGESPESNSLLFAIYETAISLPAGTTLVVKEHLSNRVGDRVIFMI